MPERKIKRVFYRLRWFNADGTPNELPGAGTYVIDDVGRTGPREQAKAFATAKEARGDIPPELFDRDKTHLRIVKVTVYAKPRVEA